MLQSRRGFLKSSAALAAASTLPQWFLEESADIGQVVAADADRPGIALVGCGGQGRGVANNAANFGRVVAVCDVDNDRVAEAKMKWPDAEGFQDFRRVMERKDVSVIVVVPSITGTRWCLWRPCEVARMSIVKSR